MTKQKWMGRIGRVIENRLMELKLTQKEFAMRVGVSRCTVCNWISGKRAMSGYSLIKVCAVLGLNFDDLPELSLFEWQRG